MDWALFFFVVFCLVSSFATGFTIWIYHKSNKNVIVIACGYRILVCYGVILGGLLVCKGDVAFGGRQFCKWQSLTLNYLLISISAHIAFIMMEACINVYHGVRCARPNQKQNNRSFFITVATFLPLIPTVNILLTHPLEDSRSIVQPMGYFCFFVRYLLSGTSGWILASLFIVLVSVIGIVRRVRQLRANLLLHTPTLEESSKASSSSSCHTPIRISSHFIQSLIVLLAWVGVSLGPGFANSILEGYEAFPSNLSSLMFKNASSLDETFQGLYTCSDLILTVEVKEFMQSYRHKMLQISQFSRLFIWAFGKDKYCHIRSVTVPYFYKHDALLKVSEMPLFIANLSQRERLKDRRLSDDQSPFIRNLMSPEDRWHDAGVVGEEFFEECSSAPYPCCAWEIHLKMTTNESHNSRIQRMSVERALAILIAMKMRQKRSFFAVSLFGLIFYFMFGLAEIKAKRTPKRR